MILDDVNYDDYLIAKKLGIETNKSAVAKLSDGNCYLITYKENEKEGLLSVNTLCKKPFKKIGLNQEHALPYFIHRTKEGKIMNVDFNNLGIDNEELSINIIKFLETVAYLRRYERIQISSSDKKCLRLLRKQGYSFDDILAPTKDIPAVAKKDQINFYPIIFNGTYRELLSQAKTNITEDSDVK